MGKHHRQEEEEASEIDRVEADRNMVERASHVVNAAARGSADDLDARMRADLEESRRLLAAVNAAGVGWGANMPSEGGAVITRKIPVAQLAALSGVMGKAPRSLAPDSQPGSMPDSAHPNRAVLRMLRAMALQQGVVIGRWADFGRGVKVSNAKVYASCRSLVEFGNPPVLRPYNRVIGSSAAGGLFRAYDENTAREIVLAFDVPPGGAGSRLDASSRSVELRGFCWIRSDADTRFVTNADLAGFPSDRAPWAVCTESLQSRRHIEYLCGGSEVPGPRRYFIGLLVMLYSMACVEPGVTDAFSLSVVGSSMRASARASGPPRSEGIIGNGMSPPNLLTAGTYHRYLKFQRAFGIDRDWWSSLPNAAMWPVEKERMLKFMVAYFDHTKPAPFREETRDVAHMLDRSIPYDTSAKSQANTHYGYMVRKYPSAAEFESLTLGLYSRILEYQDPDGGNAGSAGASVFKPSPASAR
jgi:hypothetical protein